MKLQEKLEILKQDKQAILATNFYNFETLQGIMRAASGNDMPIILQLTRGSIDYMGLDMAVKMARSALKTHEVEGWLHLDHGSDIEIVQRCLDAGFDSVMIDASTKSLKENIETTAQVVKLAESYGACVEAELGYIAKLGDAPGQVSFTDPETAKIFTENTGIDSLAIAFGSAHGFYTSTPKLAIDLLIRIKESIDIPFVLHGGSGIPDDQIISAISNGICKINLATETKAMFMNTLVDALGGSSDIDLRNIFPIATNAVMALILSKLDVINTKIVAHD